MPTASPDGTRNEDSRHIVYFSVSENTHRFVMKVGAPAHRIPTRPGEPPLRVTDPFVLVLPSYGGGHDRGAVPRQVIRFLNDPDNRALLRGVVAGGNTDFGAAWGRAGDIVAAKCQVPLLHRFELAGTDDDVAAVRKGLT